MNCKKCGKPVEQTPAKRQREFCNSDCRASHWQKQKSKNKAENYDKLPKFLKKDVKPVVSNLTPDQSKEVLDSAKNSVKPNRPSLQEIRNAMPEDYGVMERSAYMTDQKRKWGYI
jgi:hypothetical protein